jgi:hypothetical protein
MCWTQQCSSAMVFEAAVKFLISSKRWTEDLTLGSNPINDSGLQTLGVISPSIIYTLLNLKKASITIESYCTAVT